MTDKRMKNPTQFWPDIPGYLVPLLQSQAVQEEKMDKMEKSQKALWASHRQLPCQVHETELAVMEERVSKLEKTKEVKQEAEVKAEAQANALIKVITEHPKASAAVSIIVAVTGALLKLGGII